MQQQLGGDGYPESTEVEINGWALDLTDHPESDAIRIISEELRRDTYNLERIQFRPGDVVVDIGAHVGIVSIYLAKRFPFLQILAYEPTPWTHEHLVRNLSVNAVSNVRPFNLAVTSDGRDLEMTVHLGNTGGATGQLGEFDRAEHRRFHAPSTTLEAILENNGVERCRLLKLDCEGSEHEILHQSDCLDRFDYLVSEFHINDYLTREQGYSLEGLVKRCREAFAEERLSYTTIRMAD